MMQILVRAFASYREAIGSPNIRLDVPEGSTPHQVWERLLKSYPRLSTLPKPHAFAINEEYVQENYSIRERDELVLLPPVSGGAPESTQSSQSTAAWVELVEQAININQILERVKDPQGGAVVLFLGTVRDNSRGRHVKFLEYEAYRELALKEMRRVAEEAQTRWPLLGVAIVHRLGRLEIGDISVAIAVSSPHRKDAFEAGRYAIDALKQAVPIWKKEVWEGGEVWIGSEQAKTL